MKQPIKTLLKEIYMDEINKIKIPVYPYQDIIGTRQGREKKKYSKKKPIRNILFKVAGMIIILGTLGFLLATSKPGKLAVNISKLSEKFKLSERIPAGVQYIQKAYQDSNKLTL